MDNKGVYLSRTDTSEWEPDTDVGGANHMLFDHGRTMAGVWKADPDAPRRSVAVEIPARETILVLEGSVRVAIDGVEPRELTAGDMISMPEGSLVGWDAASDCRVFWVYQ